MLEIYYCNSKECPELKEVEHLLSKKRIQKSLSTNQKKQSDSITVGLLLSYISLKNNMSPEDILYNSNGKPYFRNNKTFLSVSHSEGHVVCAISDTPIGVDVQKIRLPSERLVNRVCTEQEINYIKSNDCARRFTRLWALKESYLKLTGQGLSGGLKNIVFCDGSEELTSYENNLYYLSEKIDNVIIAISKI